MISGLLLALGALLFQPTAGDGAKPTGKWVVDFGDSYCAASLAYGTEDAPRTLVVKPVPMGEQVQFSLVTQETYRFEETDDATFTANGEILPAQLVRFGTRDGKLISRFVVRTSMEDLAAMEVVDG